MTALLNGYHPDDVKTEDLEARWHRDNQRFLTLAAAAVAAHLDGRPDDARKPSFAADALANDVHDATGRRVALDELTDLFGLTTFERAVLLGAAAQALGLPTSIDMLTFAGALATLPHPHWSAVLPDAPLRGWRLLDLPDGGEVTSLRLVADERIVHGLLGARTIDQRLAGWAVSVGSMFGLGPEHEEVALDLARLVQPGRPLTPVWLTGEDRLTRREVAVHGAARLDLDVLVATADAVPAQPDQCEHLARALAREAALGGRMLLLEGSRAVLGRLAMRAASANVPVALSPDDDDDLHEGSVDWPRLALPRAAVGSRVSLITRAVLAHGGRIDPSEAMRLAERYPLTPGQISRAADRATRLGGENTAEAFEVAARVVVTPTMRHLVTVRPSIATLDDLVLPEPAMNSLEALLATVRQRPRVHDEWGYAERGRGLAVTALFAGPSGTGKTMAAEAIARELGRELMTIDLSQVVNKYIGETEKNLSQIFEAAEGGGAMLLFDEADALFGRRTSVTSSHDRYANLEVAYLLQRLETFDGIALLTTNARDNVDPAFTRRLRFVVTFPFPDAAQRSLLWQRAFPGGVPTKGLEPDLLAQLSVSGGTIAQLAVHAAFLAADEGGAVEMRHLLAAARIECDKLDRPLAPAEIKGWVTDG